MSVLLASWKEQGAAKNWKIQGPSFRVLVSVLAGTGKLRYPEANILWTPGWGWGGGGGWRLEWSSSWGLIINLKNINVIVYLFYI